MGMASKYLLVDVQDYDTSAPSATPWRLQGARRGKLPRLFSHNLMPIGALPAARAARPETLATDPKSKPFPQRGDGQGQPPYKRQDDLRVSATPPLRRSW